MKKQTRKHDLLRRTLRFNGITQKALADGLKISRTAVIRRLNSITPFSVAEAYAILRMLHEDPTAVTTYFPEAEEI